MIVVVGGDGTMNEVVDGIVSCDMVTLGYIPVGTGSDSGARAPAFEKTDARNCAGFLRRGGSGRSIMVGLHTAMMCSDIGVLLSARGSGWMRKYASYAAFGDQKYLQPDSSAAIVVPDTGIYTVFEGETDPGVYFARWNAPGGI